MKSYTVATIMENHAKIFGKLTLTFCFNSAFKTHPNEVNNFAIYIKEEIFVRVVSQISRFIYKCLLVC